MFAIEAIFSIMESWKQKALHFFSQMKCLLHLPVSDIPCSRSLKSQNLHLKKKKQRRRGHVLTNDSSCYSAEVKGEGSEGLEGFF